MTQNTDKKLTKNTEYCPNIDETDVIVHTKTMILISPGVISCTNHKCCNMLLAPTYGIPNIALSEHIVLLNTTLGQYRTRHRRKDK